MLHDIGKYSLAFQEKIKNNSDKRVDHSTAGAKECFKKGRMYEFMSYCIAVASFGDCRIMGVLLMREMRLHWRAENGNGLRITAPLKVR